jgi:hypothetical protein
LADGDVFSAFDPLVQTADVASSPWTNGVYVPDHDLLRDLLEIPIRAGEKQESGRTAKAFDAWLAHELRRAGFDPDGVWPRARRPRILPADVAPLERAIESLGQRLEAFEAVHGPLKPADLRRAIRKLPDLIPGTHQAYILGEFYAKQVDVAISTWRRGPEILISTKTMFSSFKNNLRNRHEEAVGEVASLRMRHPQAVIGFAYLVRRTIFDVEGAYAILLDILTRLRRPSEAFDATMLLVVDWDDAAGGEERVQVDGAVITALDEPVPELSAGSFFTSVIDLTLARSPAAEHVEARRRRSPEQVGGVTEGEIADEETTVPDETEDAF